MKIKVKKYAYDEFPGYYFMLVLYLNAMMFVDIVRLLSVTFIPDLSDNVNMVRDLLYIIGFAYLIIDLLIMHLNRENICIFCIVSALTVLSVIIYPQIFNYLFDDVVLLFTRVLIGYLYFRYAEDYQKIIEYENKLWPIVVIYAYIIYFIGNSRNNYMSVSYNLLIPTAIFITSGIKNKKLMYVVIGAINLLVILMYGSRGALLSGVIAVTLFYIHIEKMTIKKSIVLVVVIILIGYLAFNLEEILIGLTSKFGYSRTISLLLSGRIAQGGGRQIRQTITISNIGLLPKGIFADRIYIAKGLGISINSALYPHNIFLELLLQFGYILGFLICCALVVLYYKCFVSVKDDKTGYLGIAFYSFAVTYIVRSMLSGSYLIDYVSGIALGCCVHIIKLQNSQ